MFVCAPSFFAKCSDHLRALRGIAVRPMLGTTMSVTGHLPRGVRYRATLIFANGGTGEARACVLPAGRQTAFEHWPKAVVGVRLDRFRPAPASSACR